MRKETKRNMENGMTICLDISREVGGIMEAVRKNSACPECRKMLKRGEKLIAEKMQTILTAYAPADYWEKVT